MLMHTYARPFTNVITECRCEALGTPPRIASPYIACHPELLLLFIRKETTKGTTENDAITPSHAG